MPETPQDKAPFRLVSQLPSPEISGFIKEFFYLVGEWGESRTMVAIDDGCYDFMFYQEEVATITYGEASTLAIDNKAFTVHPYAPPLAYNFGDQMHFFSVKAQPWANAYFFPGREGPGLVNLPDLYGPAILDLHQRVFESASFPEKVAHAERFLIQHIQKTPTPDFDLARQLCLQVYEHQGKITVDQLAEHFGVSRQVLNKVFLQHVLCTLKKFIITVRILALVKYRLNHPDLSLTEVAYQFDYYDQAHFNRDFKRISGVTPRRFFLNLPPWFSRLQLAQS
ncbi:MAG: helix-turn-helix transcriptional regulator [Bacteroidota bacterium]